MITLIKVALTGNICILNKIPTGDTICFAFSAAHLISKILIIHTGYRLLVNITYRSGQFNEVQYERLQSFVGRPQ